jgi:hypothetical protein
MMSEAFSAIMMVGPFRLPLVICAGNKRGERRGVKQGGEEGEERDRKKRRYVRRWRSEV